MTIGVFFLVPRHVILPHVTEVFQEQHCQHVIFVDLWIDHPTEGVTCTPCRFVDLCLCDGSHGLLTKDDFDKIDVTVQVELCVWVINQSVDLHFIDLRDCSTQF